MVCVRVCLCVWFPAQCANMMKMASHLLSLILLARLTAASTIVAVIAAIVVVVVVVVVVAVVVNVVVEQGLQNFFQYFSLKKNIFSIFSFLNNSLVYYSDTY